MKTCAYLGNSWIGLFLRTNDTVTLVPRDAPPKLTERIHEQLGTEIVPISVADSNLIGVYCTMNNSGMVVPNVMADTEIAALKKTGLRIYRSRERFNAHGNNIAVNDAGGIIHPQIATAERKRMEEALGVELVPQVIAQHTTVGSTCLAGTKGWLAHYNATPEDEKHLESIFRCKGMRGSMNTGAGYVGLAAISNKRSYLAGEASTAFELGRLEEALGFL